VTRSDSPGFVARVGLAVAAPRLALAVGDDAGSPGRPGSDLLRLFAVILICVHTRALFAAFWLGSSAAGITSAGHALISTVSQALTAPLAFLVVGTAVVWIGGGSRRSLGRAFDLACVALVPLLVLEIVGTLVLRLLPVPEVARLGVLGAGFAWSGALLALALIQMRRPRRGGAA
jgi:hypothetical protein